MSQVNTIRGPIDSAALGRTLSHEHLTNGSGGMEHFPGLMDTPERRQEMVDRCVAALARVHQSGIDSVIDLTPFDLGRQMWLFQEVAKRHAEHGVNVVCATGVYRWVPAIYNAWSEDEIAAHFAREVTEGIEGSGIKAGIIKLAWDLEARLTDGRVSPRMMLERTARGAARASKATGVPISCHTLATDALGTPLLDLFESEGLDLRAVTIGHSNDTTDMAYLTGLAKRGATVGLDRFFSPDPAYVEARSTIALGLVQAGYAAQTCLGHDGSAAGFWGRWNPEARPEVWTLVPDHEVPWLRAHGASDADIDALLSTSIRSTFEAAAGMAGR
jgi:phosphotriesterase-related protein